MHDRITALRGEVLLIIISLTPPCLIEMPVPGLCVRSIEVASFYYFSVGFWNCSYCALFWFSLSCAPCIASFSRLPICDFLFGIL